MVRVENHPSEYIKQASSVLSNLIIVIVFFIEFIVIRFYCEFHTCSMYNSSAISVECPKPGPEMESSSGSVLLADVFQGFEAEGIDAVLWKGADRIESTLAGIGDTDLLVRSSDFEKSRRIQDSNRLL